MRVVFRKFKDGEVIALFPGTFDKRTVRIMSYMHMGQHAETAPFIGDTKLAEPADYMPLFKELRDGIGYTDLRVVKRLNLSSEDL